MAHLSRLIMPLTVLACLLAPREVPAQLFQSGPYIGASAGIVLFTDNEGSIGPVGTGIEFDPGYDLALQLGYRFSLIRTELELEYGEAAVDRVRVGNLSVDPDMSFSYLRGTVGAYVDLALLPLLTPYVGGGVGIAYVDGDATVVDGVTIEIGNDTHLTAHGEVGLSLGFLPFISIVPAYRFIWIDTAEGEIDDTTAHVVKLGARLEF